MRAPERDVKRAREILIELIDLSGVTRREVENRLLDEEAGTDVNRVLAGKLDLKLRHILNISRVIGLDPGIFFILLLPEPEASSLLDRIRPLLTAEHKRLRRVATRVAPGIPAEDLDPVRRGVSALIEHQRGSSASRAPRTRHHRRAPRDFRLGQLASPATKQAPCPGNCDLAHLLRVRATSPQTGNFFGGKVS